MPPLPRGHRLSWAGFRLPHQHTTSSLLDSLQPSNPQTALSAVFYQDSPCLTCLALLCTSILHTVSRYLRQTAGYRLRPPPQPLLRPFLNILVPTLCGAGAPNHNATSPPPPLVLPRTSATSWASLADRNTPYPALPASSPKRKDTKPGVGALSPAPGR